MDFAEKIESYLIKLGLTFEKAGDDTWIINDEEKGLERVIVAMADPLVIVRVKVMEVPEGDNKDLFEKLLRYNANDLVHGAYAIDNDDIIIVDTLEFMTMDLEEIEASLDAIGLALVQHYPILSQYRK